jgi:hypothetical protein
MPIRKKKGETKNEFLGRCIPIELEKGFEQNQAVAMCYNYWTTENLSDIRKIRRRTYLNKFKTIYGNTRTRNGSIKSSNVWKFKWNDETGDLVVKFQDGSTYTYFGVSQLDFEAFSTGSGGVCETEGSNRWGSWDIGKNPSVGAAVWDVLMTYNYSEGGSV